jgi:hypothetical protein
MCESKLVGLKGCSADVPVTNLYIDQLGITEGFLSNLITSQYDTPKELFEDKLGLAWQKIKTQFLASLTEFIACDTVIDNRKVGQIAKDYTLQNPALTGGKYGGIRLIIQPQTTSFLKVIISNILLYIEATNTNVPVLLFDLQTGKLIDTITYATGGVEQYISQAFKSGRSKVDIALVYQVTMSQTKTVPKYGSCTDCSGRVKDVAICPFVNAIGVEFNYSAGVISNIANKGNTYGMSINYAVECDRDAYLCSVGATMSLALLYATAVEIYDYALTVSPNERVNTTVSLNTEQLAQARDIYAAKYNDEMNITLKSFRVPSDRHCFKCRPNQRYVTVLP